MAPKTRRGHKKGCVLLRPRRATLRSVPAHDGPTNTKKK